MTLIARKGALIIEKHTPPATELELLSLGARFTIS